MKKDKRMKQENEKSIFEKIFFIILTIIGAIIIVTWIGSITYQIFFLKGSNSLESKGQFGDMFGSINSLFSALAFGGIIYTIFLQKTELALQREEIKRAGEALEGQKKEFETQNKISQKQQFENTFFNLLKLHNEIISNIESVKKLQNMNKKVIHLSMIILLMEK